MTLIHTTNHWFNAERIIKEGIKFPVETGVIPQYQGVSQKDLIYLTFIHLDSRKRKNNYLKIEELNYPYGHIHFILQDGWVKENSWTLEERAEPFLNNFEEFLEQYKIKKCNIKSELRSFEQDFSMNQIISSRTVPQEALKSIIIKESELGYDISGDFNKKIFRNQLKALKDAASRHNNLSFYLI